MTDYGSITMGTTEVKAWDFPNIHEVDIEIWNDGNYVTTITVSTLTGAVLHNAKG